MPTTILSNADNLFTIVDANRVVYGLDGADRISGNGFDNAIYYGGQGNDTLHNNSTSGYGNFYGGSGSDWLYSNASSPNDDMYGGEGNDVIQKVGSGGATMDGGSGTDAVYGGTGNDRIFGGDGDDSNTANVTAGAPYATYQTTKAGGLYGGDGDDHLNGGTGNDYVSGDNGADVLYGGSDDDTLTGGDGKDKLWGGDGADSFLFDAAIGKANHDWIKDFESGIDKFLLDDAIFTAIGPKLGKKEFVIAKKAKDGNDHIIYNKKKGKLFYDEDGKGGADKELFAKVDKKMDLDHHDFLIV